MEDTACGIIARTLDKWACKNERVFQLMNTQSSAEKKNTCVLTLQAARPGGVPTVVDWWHTFLSDWGQRPTTLFAAFDDGEISRRERLRQTIHNWPAHVYDREPHPTLAVAAAPLPLWLFFAVPQFVFGPLINRFDQHVVTGGPCHAGLPLALRGIPYVVWIGTLYEDELQGKVLIDDPWAVRALNSPFWPILARQEKFVLRRASAILAQSPYTLRRIQEVAPEVADRAELALVPVDTTRFYPLASEDRPSERYILNVSRINDPRKNIPLLLLAFARVRQVHPDVRLVLVGDEPAPALKELRGSLGLAEAVEFKGQVSADELVTLYQGAELFVISSTQEGLGIVMLEAMACGTPVVATDCGGPEGIVVDGETGRIVPNEDAPALAEAITMLLRDPEERHTLGNKCAAYIRQNASQAVVGEILRRRFAQTFPNSPAAGGVSEEDLNARRTTNRRHLSLTLGAIWGLVVLAAFLIHQIPLHWASFQTQLLTPLLERLP